MANNHRVNLQIRKSQVGDAQVQLTLPRSDTTMLGVSFTDHIAQAGTTDVVFEVIVKGFCSGLCT